MIESLKQKISIYITLFQYCSTIFIGLIAACATYVTNNTPDAFIGLIGAIALTSGISGIHFILKAEQLANEITQ